MAEGKSSPDSQRTEVDEQALARILRCDPVTIRRYVRQGVIKREPNKKFALFHAIGNVVEHLRAVAGNQGSGDAQKAGAALKVTQRQLAEVKLQRLNGQLLSMAEIEMLWGDLAAASKWLFLTIPVRIRGLLSLAPEQEEQLRGLCAAMLREVAFNGQLQLPGKGGTEEGREEDEEDEPVVLNGDEQ